MNGPTTIQEKQALRGELPLECGCESKWRCSHVVDISTPEGVDALIVGVKAACWATLPSKVNYAATVPDDIRAEVWEKLLENKIIASGSTRGDICRAAYKEARHRCTDWCRKELQTMPASQMELPTIGGKDESGQPDDEGERSLPWDWETYTSAVNIDDTMVASINESVVRDMMGILDKDDRRFMARYLRKSSTHTTAQRKRFERLKKKLQKVAETEESHFI